VDAAEIMGCEDLILRILRALDLPTPDDHEIAMIGKVEAPKEHNSSD
jgi:hypothetical protein